MTKTEYKKRLIREAREAVSLAKFRLYPLLYGAGRSAISAECQELIDYINGKRKEIVELRREIYGPEADFEFLTNLSIALSKEIN